MAVAFAGICHAQDVLVKKDGSTILAKVLKITETEVEYKDFNNQDGPTRVISIANLQAINYQNGQKETFSEQTTNPAQKPDIVTNETVTKFSNDQQLMQMYNMAKLPSPEQMQKKAKRLKIAGWTVGGVLFVGGVVALGRMHADCYCDGYYDEHHHAFHLGIGIPFISAGIVTWSGCYFRARKLERLSRYSVQSAPVFQQEFNVGNNDRLVVGLDMLKDNTMKNQTLGMGLTYNF